MKKKKLVRKLHSAMFVHIVRNSQIYVDLIGMNSGYDGAVLKSQLCLIRLIRKPDQLI